MSFLPYLHFTDTITKIGGVLTLSVNLFLIWITVFHIKNIKGGYKTLIISLANLEIIFSLFEFPLQPFLHSYNSGFVYFTIDPVHGASGALKLWILLIYSSIYALLICIITIQFLYRYLVITGAMGLLKSLERWWWVHCTFWTTTWMAAFYQSVPDKDAIDYLREEMISKYAISDMDQVTGFFIVVYNPQGSFRTDALITFAGLIITLSVQYLIIVICGFKIQMVMNKTFLQMSPKTQKVQKQLFKTLIFQMLNPFIFHHIPAFLLLITTFLNLKISLPSGIVIAFFSLFPAIDSLVMMWLVTEYQAVMRLKAKKRLLKMVEWAQKFNDSEENETEDD